MPEERVNQLARSVELLLMDVDGVLTDGRLFWVPVAAGLITETKGFDVTDGAGIVFARTAGLRIGVITKRKSEALGKRARELKMTYIYDGVDDKRAALEAVCREANLDPSRICYVGDDLPDLHVMTRVGFPVAVQNARPEVKSRAAYVTTAFGGRGAIREVVELILKAQNKWSAILDSFLQ